MDFGFGRIPWRRLVALARPEWLTIASGTVALLIGSAMSLAAPQAVKFMVDAVLQRGDMRILNVAAGALVVTWAVQAVFVAIRAWQFTIAGERLVARLRGDLFAALIGQDVAFFDQARTGDLVSRLASDTTALQNAITVNVSMGLRFGLGAIGGLALLFWTSPILTLVAMAIVPFVAIGGALYGRMLRRQSQEFQDALGEASNVAEETLSSLRTVRAFAREPLETLRYRAAVERSYQVAASRAVALGVFNGVGGFAGFLGLTFIGWYGCRLVLLGSMSPGDLTAFLLYTTVVAVSMATLATLYGDFMKAVGASERVFELMDKVATLEGAGGAAVASVRGALRFDGVEFAYPTRPDMPVLTAFDLDIQQGEVVALVGHSGSGKSTVASLLLRLYDPLQGVVSVDGQDLRGLSPKSLREHIGIVSQEPVLFATSIAENIRYGRLDATDEQVREAAKAANALDFIEGFPDGFKTLVGERGVQLSGGQKQRVAIARALLKDPPILILDEATSALDAESEHLVQEALDRLMKGRTTLVIAHRLSTVQGADRVVVLDHGKVVEQGTHGELVSRDGLYKKLVQRQFALGADAA